MFAISNVLLFNYMLWIAQLFGQGFHNLFFGTQRRHGQAQPSVGRLEEVIQALVERRARQRNVVSGGGEIILCRRANMGMTMQHKPCQHVCLESNHVQDITLVSRSPMQA